MKRLALLVACLVAAVFIPTAGAAYKDDIGYTQLAAELGINTPDGSGISILQIEASVSGTSTVYAPDQNVAEFSGKTFSLFSGSTTPSWHGTKVGRFLYGNTTSIAPGVTDVGVMAVNTYLNTVLRPSGTATPPSSAYSQYKVQNHSWVGSTGNQTNDTIYLSRNDYMIARDNTVSVVGVNNSGTAGNQPLLSLSYNSISVGLSSGNHAWATTGIVRPHIVVPMALGDDATSFATPVVAGAATILLETADGTNAENNVVIKALLMAGTTKSQFPSWSRTDTRPIDDEFGSGQLNVYNSYQMLSAGEQNGAASPVSTVTNTGWDYGSVSAGQSRFYFFDLAADGEVTVSLNWNAIYLAPDPPGPSLPNYDNMSLSLANLDLYLYSVLDDSFTIDSIVQQSISDNQNLEYLWANSLVAGRYAVEVRSFSGGSDYGLAWIAVPEPTSLAFLLAGSGFLFVLRFRQRQSR